ncbi:MAG: serine hydrolase [Acidimicrobiia bacterium]|nr:serine hydrolase [Acidimicrobiia bacterium]
MKWSLGFLALACFAQGEPSLLLEKKMLVQIEKADAALDGVLGVAAIDLETGRVISYNGGTAFPQASSIKIPIMMAMFESAREARFPFTGKLTLTEKDVAGGSGHLNALIAKAPHTLTVLDLVTAMIETSDNTATNKCIAMAGMDRVNRILNRLGLANTRLQRIMMDTAAAAADRENISTPLEMARMVEMIYRGTAAHPDDCRKMLEIMSLVKGGMRKAVPAEVAISSKTGSVTGVRCETGVIKLPGRPFVLSVTSTFLGSQQINPVEEVTRIVYHYFERLSRANRYGHQVQ